MQQSKDGNHQGKGSLNAVYCAQKFTYMSTVNTPFTRGDLVGNILSLVRQLKCPRALR